MKAYSYNSTFGQPLWGWISTKLTLTAAALMLLLQSTACASDPIGVFALIDKVVMEPNPSAPERIQIWGAFALADRKDRDAYQAPKKGYLYYSLPKEKADVARKEWNDLKNAAGKNEVIGFGSRYEMKSTVRSGDTKPLDPDTYVIGWGLVKMSQRNPEYPPIKALLALKRADKAEAK